MYKEVFLKADSFRLIPSHFPPIGLFENLLDPDELEAAYELESLTNDRLKEEVGRLSFVAPEDRMVGTGTTPIMAAFTHVGIESRFTDGSYGVYYAGLDLETSMAEAKHSRARFLSATNEESMVLTMRCYKCKVDALLTDLKDEESVQTPDDFQPAQAIAYKLKQSNSMGILYRSVRNPEGLCVAALRPKALTPPAVQSGHYQFHWNGKEITHVTQILSS